MTTLLTGASGFVGAALLRRLRGDGCDAVALVRTSSSRLPPVSVPTVRVGEIVGTTDFSEALAGITTVVHLAARAHIMRDTAADPLTAFRAVNVEGTLNLARQSAAVGVKRFVFISSVKVNGEATLPGRPFTADDVPAPLDPYGVSKMEAEQGLRQIAAETGMEVVIIRPPLVYGPGVKANFAALMRAVQRGWARCTTSAAWWRWTIWWISS